MRKTKIVSIEQELTDKVICNKCGTNMFNEMNVCGLSADVYGAYDSTHLFDGNSYHFDLCEECLTKLFNEFKHPVDIQEYI